MLRIPQKDQRFSEIFPYCRDIKPNERDPINVKMAACQKREANKKHEIAFWIDRTMSPLEHYAL